MSTASNTQKMLQHALGDDDPSTGMPERNSPSNMNIQKQVVYEEACSHLKRNLSPQDNSDEWILEGLVYVWIAVKRALEQDPKMKEHLASMEEFRDNVTRRGEKKFINSLRAMAANSDTQGSKAWDDLFEDGCTSFGFLWVQAF